MRIATFATTDSLDLGPIVELRKWEAYLRDYGHQVTPCRGELTQQYSRSQQPVVIPELSAMHSSNVSLFRAAVGLDGSVDAKAIISEVQRLGSLLSRTIAAIIDSRSVDAILVDSVCSYPFCMPLAVASKMIAEKSDVKILARDHDFTWETLLRQSEFFNDHFAAVFPPVHDNILHVTTTGRAADNLRQRRPEALTHIFPNLFNFAVNPLLHNPRKFRARVSAESSDILLVQPTRCVPAKGVHHSLHLAKHLADSTKRRVTLAVTGGATVGIGRSGIARRYQQSLETLARSLRVNLAVLNGSLSDCAPGVASAGDCISDAYFASDIVTFPTIIEGFGNPAIESAAYQRPLVTSRYPVLVDEFLSRGLEFTLIEADGLDSVDDEDWHFSIWDSHISRHAIDSAVELLDWSDGSEAARLAQKNCRIAASYYADTPDNRSRYFDPLIRWLEG